MTSIASHKKNVWLLVLIFFLFSMAIGAAGYFFYEQQKKSLKQEKWNMIDSIASLKVNQIKNWRRDRIKDTQFILASPFITHNVNQFLENPEVTGIRQELLKFMSSLAKGYHYQRIFLLDAKGKVHLSAPEGIEVIEPHVKKLALEAISQKRVILSDLYRSDTTGLIRISLLVPIFDPQEKDTLPVGLLLLRIDPYEFLYPLLQSWPTYSLSFECVLVRREGDDVLVLNDLVHKQDAALKIRLAISDRRLPAVMAVLEKGGIVEGMDYRGVPVIAALRPISDSPWFLVAKVDQEEIYAPIRVRARFIAALVGLLIAGAALSVVFLWRGQRLQFQKKQYEAELERRALTEHFSHLSRYANDIILLMDQGLKILEANDRAVESYGYSREELLQLSLKDLRVPETRPVLEADMKKVKEHNGFILETLHQRKDGTRFPVENSSRMVEVDGKHFYQSIIRDVTERKQAEKKLISNENRFRKIVENNSDAMIIVNGEGIVWFVNPAAEILFGLKAKELLGELFGFPVIIGKKIEIDIPRKTGERAIAEMHLTEIEWEEKNAYLVSLRDVTERKQAEEALRESEETARALVNATIDSVFLIDTAGIILALNEITAKRIGKSVDEMLGSYLYDFLQPDVAKRRKTRLDEVFRTGKPAYFEDERQGIWFDTCGYPIFDATGKVTKLAIYGRDITERKRAEENLKESEQNARQFAEENAAMAEIGRIISSTLNIDEIYESFAKEVKKIISFDRIVINIIDTEKGTVRNVYTTGEGVQDRNVKNVYPLEGSGNAEMVRTKSTFLIQTEDFNDYQDRFPMLLSTFQAGFRSIMNVPLFSKGKIIGGLLLRSYKPYAYSDKNVGLAERIGSQIAGAIANAQLYADRIQAEKEKAALEEQLRQSQKMEAIGRLAGGIAHDFNNLLTVIKGYSQLSLAGLKESDPLKGNIDQVNEAADRAADLTRQLLAFSRRQVLEMKVLNLNAVLKNLDKMLHRVIGEDVELVNLLTEDLGRVKGDPGQVEQVIMNLAVNARDAMPNGGKLTLETANVELDEEYARTHVGVTPGRYVMLSLSDTGVGMTPEVKEQVFEPFFTTKEKNKGTGLGLSTVYGIVKQSGGNIWVYSEPGKGTTFKIYLPRVDEPLEEIKTTMVKDEILRGDETVLVVEDDEVVRKLAVQVLRERGYTVLEAPQGLDAFLICAEHDGPIHLLLTDVVMPKMSGRELAEALISLRPGIKVLYMSGYTGNAIVHHGILIEGTNYIQKPFTVEGLARKVREVLDK